MDYSREFSPDRDVQNESVTLSARFNMLRRDKRRLGTSDETDRRDNELISSVLALADQIHDDFLKRTGVLGTRSDASVRQLALVPPPAPPAPAADNEELAAAVEPQPASQWEQSRTRFLEAPAIRSVGAARCILQPSIAAVVFESSTWIDGIPPARSQSGPASGGRSPDWSA